MKAEVNVHCPHWKDPADPMVIEGIKLTFGKVLLSQESTEHDPFGVLSLLRCFNGSSLRWKCAKLTLITLSTPFLI